MVCPQVPPILTSLWKYANLCSLHLTLNFKSASLLWVTFRQMFLLRNVVNNSEGKLRRGGVLGALGRGNVTNCHDGPPPPSES